MPREIHPGVECFDLVMVVSNQVDLRLIHSFFVYYRMKTEILLVSLAGMRQRMGFLFLSSPRVPVL